jgi:hypothetical protein
MSLKFFEISPRRPRRALLAAPGALLRAPKPNIISAKREATRSSLAGRIAAQAIRELLAAVTRHAHSTIFRNLMRLRSWSARHRHLDIHVRTARRSRVVPLSLSFSGLFLKQTYPAKSIPGPLWYGGALLQWVILGAVVDFLRRTFRKAARRHTKPLN